MDSPEKGDPGPSVLDFDDSELQGFISSCDFDGIPRKLQRYEQAKARSVQFADSAMELLESQTLYDFGLMDRLRKVRCCAQILSVERWYDSGSFRISSPFWCNQHLLCALCAVRRSSRLLSRAIRRLAVVDDCIGLSHMHLYFLTLTVKSSDDLREVFDHIKGAFAFMRTARKSRHHATVFKCISGAMYSIEIIRGKNGQWHPHIHMLIATYDPLPLEQVDRGARADGTRDVWWRWPALQDEWLAVTGDSHYVDCRPVVATGADSLVPVCCEVFKYAMKFASLDPADRLEAYRVVTGPPRCMLSRCMGEFYGLGIDSPDSKEQWRFDQACAQEGAGDSQRLEFNTRYGLYELQSLDVVIPRTVAGSSVGEVMCDAAEVVCDPADIPF